MVFAKASPASLAVKAAAWSEPVQRFLKRCADAGNLEACYILGMVRLDEQIFVDLIVRFDIHACMAGVSGIKC
jgi:hypothetical protein